MYVVAKLEQICIYFYNIQYDCDSIQSNLYEFRSSTLLFCDFGVQMLSVL